MKRRTKALQFSRKTIDDIAKRDGACIFCKTGYKMPERKDYTLFAFDIMHIVSKAQGGLGIEQNGVLGCRYHHNLLDASLNRHEMMGMIDRYMKGLYPDWNREDLLYDKTKL